MNVKKRTHAFVLEIDTNGLYSELQKFWDSDTFGCFASVLQHYG